MRFGLGSMVVRFTTTYAISTYYHQRCEFELRSWRGVFEATLRDNVCQSLATGRWIAMATPVPPTVKLTATI